MATKEELENLCGKIECEGGLCEYTIHYGGKFPDITLSALAVKLEKAYNDLQLAIEREYDRHGVETY